jgi:phage FluMu gp28-like protein
MQPMLKSPLTLYPYQKRWIEDRSSLKIATKARRIGYSFAAGLAAVLACLREAKTIIVLSRSERLSKEFVERSVAPHVRALGVIAEFINGSVPETSIFKQEVRIGRGRILAFPANPDTARSYEGDVLLDEFAFQRDARKIFEAIEPSITRGFSLSIISTPNGQQGSYFELAKEAGLVDGFEQSTRWSAHKTDIYQAVQQGCLDRFGNPLIIDQLRQGCLDEEMWQQEYGCQFLSIASQWISPELFEANISSEANASYPLGSYRNLYAGWDVARNKDLSVIWLMERVGDVSWTRGVVEMKNVPTPDQIAEARRLMPMIRRLVIDKSSMGLAIFEQLSREFGGIVEGVQFTLATKEALAVGLKQRMEQSRLRIPDTAMIRNSFRSVKKSVTPTGQARFDAAHDDRYGHADHFWAACLAESGAAVPTLSLTDLAELNNSLQRPSPFHEFFSEFRVRRDTVF